MTTMTEDSIRVELEYINEKIDKIPAQILSAIHEHMLLCGAYQFFNNKEIQDKIVKTIQDVAFQKIMKDNNKDFFKWFVTTAIGAIAVGIAYLSFRK